MMGKYLKSFREISSLFVLAILSMSGLSAQSFFTRLNDPNADFFEIQKEANAYFAKVGTGKRHVYKKYKRWEYEHMLTMDKNGKSATSYS